MIKVTYQDTIVDEFPDANVWGIDEDTEELIVLTRRKFDKEGDYDEDEDDDFAWITLSEIRKIEKC